MGGIPLITRAVRKPKATAVFDRVWVNSEHEGFRGITDAERVRFHQRPVNLGSYQATSEQYIPEFLQRGMSVINYSCSTAFHHMLSIQES